MIKEFKVLIHRGAKRCRVICEGGSFTLQTYARLPSTHQRGINWETEKEVREYVALFGSDRMKRLIGCKTSI